MADAYFDTPPRWINRFYDRADEQRVPTERGCTLVPTGDAASGWREFICVEAGLSLLVSQVRYRATNATEFRTDDAFKFHFRMAGSGQIEVGGDAHQVKPHTGALLATHAGLRKVERHDAGDCERSVTVMCAPSYLARLAAGDAELPESIQQLMRKTSGYLPFALSSEMTLAAEGLLACTLQGELRCMYAQGRALELLALSLATLSVRDHMDPEGMSGRDAEKIGRAKVLLERDFVRTPTIPELARDVGTNEAKLMQGFKQLYGQTIFDFTQTRRMEHARRLLEETDRSITEIAFDVGYEYPSNFTTAFKRHFGVTPKIARRGYRL